MGTMQEAQETAILDKTVGQVKILDHISGLESTRRLKDLVHASTAVRMLITIILTSGTFVLLTFLTSLM
jgi:hypothetical protein